MNVRPMNIVASPCLSGPASTVERRSDAGFQLDPEQGASVTARTRWSSHQLHNQSENCDEPTLQATQVAAPSNALLVDEVYWTRQHAATPASLAIGHLYQQLTKVTAFLHPSGWIITGADRERMGG